MMQRSVRSPRPSSFLVPGRTFTLLAGAVLAAVYLVQFPGVNDPARAQGTGPSVIDPKLGVRTVVSGLSMPISMAFLADNDILVLEKETGKVQRVRNGVVDSTRTKTGPSRG